jgi:hypothetical protein
VVRWRDRRGKGCHWLQYPEHKLKPFKSRHIDETRPLKWMGLIFWTVAASFGVGLAFNIGNIEGRMAYKAMRSPLTIAFTTFVRENCHPHLFEWEQDLFAHLPLVPYFLSGAIAIVFVLSPKQSQSLVMFPLAYAVVAASQLLLRSEYYEWMGIRWYHMIPSALYVFCYAPITQVGLNITGHLKSFTISFIPRLLALVSVFGIAILCIAFVRIKSLQPILLLIVLCALTYLTRRPFGEVEQSD